MVAWNATATAPATHWQELAEGYDPATVLPSGETLGDVLDQARRALRRHLAETPLEILNPGAIHPELRKQLEALGYL